MKRVYVFEAFINADTHDYINLWLKACGTHMHVRTRTHACTYAHKRAHTRECICTYT